MGLQVVRALKQAARLKQELHPVHSLEILYEKA